MGVLGSLSPALVWEYFEEICKIPRFSKHEEKIREYLLKFAGLHALSSFEDKVGNILIIRPASPGYENKKTVVLQSHMDMVGENRAGFSHNWLTDSVIPYIDNGWVRTNGTTLGADDGIGMAAAMAVLTDKYLKTGPIECLFTVDEETGMTGALNLNPGFFSGRTLINLDSEDEGILFIGCAGGMDTQATLKYEPVFVTEGMKAYEIKLTGLHGGHSGDEIHKGYGNAVKIMTMLLSDLALVYNIDISIFNGGNIRNAIPREATALIVTEPCKAGYITERIIKYASEVTSKLAVLEPDIRISVNEVTVPGTVIDRVTRDKLLDALTDCPHGVISWSKEMEDLVETSSNLASVKFEEGNIIRIVTTQRSSDETAKSEIGERVRTCFASRGAEVRSSDGYPAWKPDLSSEILQITRKSYLRLFGKDAEVKAIHAGLECGLIYEKDNEIDMISFGPTIKGAHTPEEMIEIESVNRFWKLLTDVLQNIPAI